MKDLEIVESKILERFVLYSRHEIKSKRKNEKFPVQRKAYNEKCFLEIFVYNFILEQFSSPLTTWTRPRRWAIESSLWLKGKMWHRGGHNSWKDGSSKDLTCQYTGARLVSGLSR